MMTFNEQVMFHIGLTREQGAGYAILTGDPGRVESIARLLESPEFVSAKREYTTWTGLIDGERVLVTSHGIGGPSTAICVEELAQCGVHTMIRVGTCGGMAKSVCGGDIVIANAAIRQEGTSREYMPISFPAVSDFEVTSALAETASQMKERLHIGVVHCKDSFYGQHNPENSPVSYQLINQWQTWIRGGCLASEMETASLFTVGAARRLKTGCVLHVLWNQERQLAGLTNEPVHDTSHVAKVAVGAIRRLMTGRAD